MLTLCGKETVFISADDASYLYKHCEWSAYSLK